MNRPSGLSASQLSLLRERLEQARNELRDRMRHDQSVARQSENLPEPLDAAEQTREQDDAILFTQRDVNLLHDIEDALAKLDTGQYGLSEVSGLPLRVPAAAGHPLGPHRRRRRRRIRRRIGRRKGPKGRATIGSPVREATPVALIIMRHWAAACVCSRRNSRSNDTLRRELLYGAPFSPGEQVCEM